MNTLAILQQVMRLTFFNDNLRITPEMVAMDVDGWDSLSHTILMVELERALGIEVELDEVAACENLGELGAYLDRRIAAR